MKVLQGRAELCWRMLLSCSLDGGVAVVRRATSWMELWHQDRGPGRQLMGSPGPCLRVGLLRYLEWACCVAHAMVECQGVNGSRASVEAFQHITASMRATPRRQLPLTCRRQMASYLAVDLYTSICCALLSACFHPHPVGPEQSRLHQFDQSRPPIHLSLSSSKRIPTAAISPQTMDRNFHVGPDFTLVDTCGEGAYGVVWWVQGPFTRRGLDRSDNNLRCSSAIHNPSQRRVAIKKITPFDHSMFWYVYVTLNMLCTVVCRNTGTILT
jgi:hypothetical protein